jgi:hypothetical protein
VRFGDQDDLLARLKASVAERDRPLAVLVGAGVSVGSIPGVGQTVNVIRASLDADEAILLDQRLAGLSQDTARYQESFDFLTKRKTPRHRDRVVQACTLRAFKKPLPDRDQLTVEKFALYEADVDNWRLPVGLEALGRIWSGLPEDLRGPVVTTNFDPLCEIAIRKSGSQPITKAIDEDGAFWADLRNNAAPQVVHIHGYWRDSATLHLAAELSLERPQLEGSLRALLRSHTVVVIGYGGWQDAVGKTVTRLVQEQSSRDFDILWCLFDDSEKAELQFPANPTLTALSRAPGSVAFYSSIDSNLFFPALERAISQSLEFSEEKRSYAARGSLIGWATVDPEERRVLKSDEQSALALSFFDGRLPSWPDARNRLIPRRDIANTVYRELSSSIRRPGSSFTLITGAAGEGKTLAAFQAASSIATANPDVVVMFNGEERLRSATDIASLPQDRKYLLVLDDAFLSAESLKEAVSHIHAAGTSGIHILAVSRDTDWRSTGGFTYPWSKYIPSHIHRLSGVGRLDAAAIVSAWEAIGPEALGALAAVPDTEARIEALERASRSEEGSTGTLLGALLKTRYAGNLREHVRELLTRLSEIRLDVRGDPHGMSLQDAFFMVAVPHANGLTSMSPQLLGRALRINTFELHGMVLLPLGDEAALTYNSASVLTRHRMIAQAALDLAPELGVDLDQVVRQLVGAGVEEIDEQGIGSGGKDFAYLSQHLKSRPLAVVAAHEAVELRSDRLSYRTSLSRALRKAGDAAGAALVGERSLFVLATAVDGLTGARPVFTEWGVAEGNLGNWARNCVLGGIALQDLPALGSLRREQAAPALVCLALALRKLQQARQQLVFEHALAALLAMAERIDLTPQQVNWLSEAEQSLRGIERPAVDDMTMASRLLAEGCKAAVGSLEAPLPEAMLPLRFGFSSLVALLERGR